MLQMFSRIYYGLMCRTSALSNLPATGADFFLLDRQVIKAISQFSESHGNMLALITWVGFRQQVVPYTKMARLHGSSGWNSKKRFKLLMDSITAFTYFPIRVMSYLGIATALAGFVYAGVVVWNAFRGLPIEGWASLMLVALLIGGVQMLMLGILGEYLWRALDESRRRPRYLVEASTSTVDRSA